MNHLLGLVILSLCVASVFAFISRETRKTRVRYFLTLLGYMVAGSVLAAWIMHQIPW